MSFMLIYWHMANAPDQVSEYLAQNIVSLRQKRSITQAGLAKIAGVPRSTVTHLESGSGNPSLSNLIKVASALQVTIEELLAAPRTRCKLLKNNELRAVKRSQGAVTVFKLLPDPIAGMEIDRMEIETGARMGGIPHVPGTKEYLTVIQGEVTVNVGGQAFRVREGDVLAFPGDQPHSYHNTGSRPARAFSVVALAPVGV